MEIKRLLTNICSEDLEKSKLFYTSVFSFNVDYDSDWFVHLISEGKELELGIILKSHEIVPDKTKGSISGAYLTFVIDDVDAIYKKIQSLDLEVIQTPQITPYGQKRMLVIAPEGTVCDISSPTNT